MNNPLLENRPLPAFDTIQAEHMVPALKQTLQQNEKAVAVLLKAQPLQSTWDSLMLPLDQLDNRLDHVWSPIRHLNSVMDSQATREAYDRCLAEITDYQTRMAQNRELFDAIRGVRDNAEQQQLNHAQIKALDDAITDFELNGVALDGTDKIRFVEIQQRLSALQSAFEKNLLDATQSWTHHIQSEQELAGLPESARAMAKQAAEQKGLQGWLLTLQAPSYIATMTYADDRRLREKVYTAYNTRASDQGPDAGRWDNSELIEQIMALRHERAQLLGFENYAEQSLSIKMAESPQRALDFLLELAAKAKPKAEQELAELRDFAGQSLNGEVLQAWDLAYYSEKLRQERYAISQEALKPWFPAEQVLKGLFAIVQRLFGMSITPVEAAARWHPVTITETRAAASISIYTHGRISAAAPGWMNTAAVSGVRMSCNSPLHF
jgi:oligopeptidase A